ncbi:6-phosphogluconate dehydrogenase C-terminal domain-like protein [Atractiella rhizophila]|nr:6-phosphogluconate dehydrogenase C-terminal domain-like protein [Atractiella rhizophila]
MSYTVGILYPGSMGTSLIAYLLSSHSPPLKAYTNLSSRSARTRSLCSGLVDQGSLIDLSDDAEILKKCDVVLSVLVNEQALPTAQKFGAIAKEIGAEKVRTKYFVDLNAIAPSTAEEAERCFADTSIAFVDGGIIGGPATVPEKAEGKEGSCPLLVISGEKAKEVELLLSGFGESIEVVGDRNGQASATKLAFACMSKGFLAIGVNAALLASKYDVLPSLSSALSSHAPSSLSRISNGFPNSLAKAFRWHGEMDEISKAFSDAGLAGGGRMFEGMAETYRFVSKTEVGQESVEEAKERKRKWEEVVDILARDLKKLGGT